MNTSDDRMFSVRPAAGGTRGFLPATDVFETARGAPCPRARGSWAWREGRGRGQRVRGRRLAGLDVARRGPRCQHQQQPGALERLDPPRLAGFEVDERAARAVLGRV